MHRLFKRILQIFDYKMIISLSIETAAISFSGYFQLLSVSLNVKSAAASSTGVRTASVSHPRAVFSFQTAKIRLPLVDNLIALRSSDLSSKTITRKKFVVSWICLHVISFKTVFYHPLPPSYLPASLVHTNSISFWYAPRMGSDKSAR